MQLILHITVLLCLTAIMPESFVMACHHCDYSKFVECGWPIIMDVIKTDKDQQRIMITMERECQDDIDSYKIGNSILVEITDLSISEVPRGKEPPKYTDLSNLHEITDCTDMILIIPGYNTSVKTTTPDFVAKLVSVLLQNEVDKNIYVFDVGEHLMGNYLECIFKMSDIGTKLGENLAKIPNLKTLHIIGIDLGANIAAYASRICNRVNILKIDRISALNPATLCVCGEPRGGGTISKDIADFVDVYRTTDFYGCDANSKELGSIVFQIRDEKAKNTCKTFLASTEQAVDAFIDPIMGDKCLYRIKECREQKFAVCDKDLSETEFGYAIKIDPPTADNCVTVLLEPKNDPENEGEEPKNECVPIDEPKMECEQPKNECDRPHVDDETENEDDEPHVDEDPEDPKNQWEQIDCEQPNNKCDRPPVDEEPKEEDDEPHVDDDPEDPKNQWEHIDCEQPNNKCDRPPVDEEPKKEDDEPNVDEDPEHPKNQWEHIDCDQPNNKCDRPPVDEEPKKEDDEPNVDEEPEKKDDEPHVDPKPKLDGDDEGKKKKKFCSIFKTLFSVTVIYVEKTEHK